MGKKSGRKSSKPGAVGFNLRRLRGLADLTQEELHEKSGVHEITISKLETGATKTADEATIARLAQALGVRPGELVDDSSPVNATEIEPLIQEFLKSPYAQIVQPTDDEIEWLRAQSFVFWRGKKPTPKSMSLFIEGYRASLDES